MTTVQRPTFYEGQVLAAADLTGAVAHARGALARHERYQHTAGIVTGLALTGEEQTDDAGNKYQDVTLAPGMAVDTSGRQIVVSEEVLLNADEFNQINGADVDETAWYPVFVRGQDAPVEPSQEFGAEACGPGVASSRTAEGVVVDFGRLGDARDLPDAFGGSAEDGPAAISGRVLVGYVQWSKAAGRFAAASTEAKGGIPVAYAGAQADEVAARAGRLELRTATARTPGTPAVWLDGAPARLAFGVLDGAGGLTELFSVSASGDVKAEGSVFEGSLPSGAAHVESGIATDGVVLPLPTGITQQQVDDGAVTLHMQVSPLVPPAILAPGPDFAQASIECEVDASSRRVRCLVRWFDLTGATPVPPETVKPGVCNYLVIAAVPSS